MSSLMPSTEPTPPATRRRAWGRLAFLALLLSAGAGLGQPIFLGGQLQAQVDVRTAEQWAAVADYGRVGLRAFSEVEGALSAGAAAGDRERILAQGVSDNSRALELANIRYRVGSLDLRAIQQQQAEQRHASRDPDVRNLDRAGLAVLGSGRMIRALRRDDGSTLSVSGGPLPAPPAWT